MRAIGPPIGIPLQNLRELCPITIASCLSDYSTFATPRDFSYTKVESFNKKIGLSYCLGLLSSVLDRIFRKGSGRRTGMRHVRFTISLPVNNEALSELDNIPSVARSYEVSSVNAYSIACSIVIERPSSQSEVKAFSSMPARKLSNSLSYSIRS
jgi:hypothetical protein